MKITKWLIFFTINFFFLTFTFGQNNNLTGTNSLTGQTTKCKKLNIDIIGIFNVKLNTSVEYKLKNTLDIDYQLKLLKNNQLIEQTKNNKLTYIFKNIDNYKIQADIFFKPQNCNYSIEKKINIYKDITIYMGINETFLQLNISDIYKKNNTLFKQIIIPEKGFYTQQDFLNFFKKDIYFIKNSDQIIINYPNITQILDVLVNLKNYYNIDFSNKKIYLTVYGGKNLIKKLLLKYIKLLNIKGIYLLNQNDLIDFIIKNDNTNLTYYSLSFQQTSKFYFLSYIIDYLIYKGLSTNIIGYFLLIIFSVLVITIFRQIIGLSVFSVYHPLFFALSLVLLGFKFTFALFAIGILSTLILRIITKKIYLLYSPKISLLIMIYILFFITFSRIDKNINTNIINLNAFENILIIFPFLSILFVSNKIFYEGEKILTFKLWISILEFFFISFIIYFILNSYYIKNFFLSYPEIILIILILTILIGRFTGLQLTEYIRFRPLIKKYFEEE